LIRHRECKLPQNFPDTVLSVLFPRSHVALHGRHVWDPATSKTLSFENVEFNLGYVQPDSMFRRIISAGGFSRFFRSSGTFMPFSAKRFFRSSIDGLLSPRADTTPVTFQAGPSDPASHSTRARALINRLASIFPRRVIDSSS
jgi:hypothetical protein